MPPMKRRFQQFLKTLLTVLYYAPPVLLASRFVTFIAPGTPHSTTNNLHFALVSADSPLYGDAYHVGITAGVIPKRFHAHNDYVHEIPLLKALSYGAASVEADIWLVDGELYVGHDAEDIRPDRTFKALYLDPIVAIIKAANVNHTGPRPRGVFETAPNLPLHLLIDIKTDGPSTFAKLYSVLAPLREAGYLTTYSVSDKSATPLLTPSALTIIGTGNTPLTSVQALGQSASTPRDIFLDAVLELVAADTAGIYTPELSPLASSDFGSSVGQTWMVPGIARGRIRALTAAAHERGIQARFWRTPGMPVAARNTVWQMLLDEGVDWLNVDDLAAAREF